MDFIAIDFETANAYPTSACSLGIAFVQNNQVVDRRSWLIRPEPFFFDPFTTAIHGLREEDVAQAPTFAQLWPELSAYFENAIVAAHNAPFDIGVLKSTLAFYGLPIPNMRILCTLSLSRRAFPSFASHRLNIISSTLGISLLHHQAESDAVACAEILCCLLRQNHLDSLQDLKKHYRIFPGFASASGNYRPCRLQPSYPLPKQVIAEWENSALPHKPFHEKSFVFSGNLSFPRKKAMEVVIRGGGMVQSSLSTYTDYLVLGKPRGQAAPSVQEHKAIELQKRGASIQILDEAAFLSLVDSDLYGLCF